MYLYEYVNGFICLLYMVELKPLKPNTFRSPLSTKVSKTRATDWNKYNCKNFLFFGLF